MQFMQRPKDETNLTDADADWYKFKKMPQKELQNYRAEMEARKEKCVYQDCVELLGGIDKQKWGDPETQEKLREFYRSAYRETWQWPPTAYVLANTSNFMLPDDHDFRDDW